MPTATLENPLPTQTTPPTPAQDPAASAASTGPSAAPRSTRPSSVRPARHLPRRAATATSRLRAIDTRALDLGPQVFGDQGTTERESGRGRGDDRSSRDARGAGLVGPSPAHGLESRRDPSDRQEHAVRSLSLRELVTGAGTAAGAWTLAAHLGLLGTAGGVFLISLVSTTGVALVADSLTGARRMLIRCVRGARRRRAHRRRTSIPR